RSREWSEFVSRHVGAEQVERSSSRTVYLLPATAPKPSEPGRPFAIKELTSPNAAVNLAMISDGNPRTYWATARPQRGDEWVSIDVGKPRSVPEILFSSGPATESFPRMLSVTTSVDDAAWNEVWNGTMAAPVLRGLLAAPRQVQFLIEFPPVGARYVRLH